MRKFANRFVAVILAGVLSTAFAAGTAHAVIGGSGVDNPTFQERYSSILFLTAWEKLCSAVYIGNNKALTAAHCVVTKERTETISPDLMLVRGASRFRDFGGSTAKVTAVQVHPAYERKAGAAHDVAVLVLDREIPKVPAVELASSERYFAPDQVSYFAGWGISEGNELSEALRHVTMTILSHQDCRDNHTPGSIRGPMMCTEIVRATRPHPAQFQGGGIAIGDSGGPLFVPTDKGMQLAGIASWYWNLGPNPVTSSHGISVFTRVDKIATWVHGLPATEGN